MNKKDIIILAILIVFSLLFFILGFVKFGIEFERYYFESNNTNLIKDLIIKNSLTSYLIDKQIILPNSTLVKYLINYKPIEFYIEKYAYKENQTIYFENKNFTKDEFFEYLKSLNASEIKENENNITFLIFFANSKEFENIKINYQKEIGIVRKKIVEINISLSQNQIEKLKKILENVSIKTIEFERYFDLYVVIKYDNKTYKSLIPVSYLKNPKNLILKFENINEKELEIYLSNLDAKFIKEEKYFKFVFPFYIYILIFVATLFLILKTKDFKIYYLFSFFILFSPIFSFILLAILVIYLLKNFYYKKVVYVFVFFFISILIFIFETYFSILTFLLSFFFFYLSLLNRKYENYLIFVLFFAFLALYFYEPLISFALFISFLSLFFQKIYPQVYK